ncbi:MAG: type II secretion system F family protein [Candidatus Buchananbacteria bacterium]
MAAKKSKKNLTANPPNARLVLVEKVDKVKPRKKIIEAPIVAKSLHTGNNRRRLFIRIFDFGWRDQKEGLMENLALLLNAGMDLLGALEAIRPDRGFWRLNYLVRILQEDIESGFSFWQALERTKIFRAQDVSLIKIGEQTGKLDETLKMLVLQQQKERDFSSKVKSAMAYPAFVLSVTFAVGLGIAWFILPRLATVFASLSIELPLITQILIDFGKFLGVYGNTVVPAAIIVFIVLFYLLFFFPGTKIIGQFLALRTPGIGKLIKQSEVARFGYVLGTLLSSGMPVLEALKSLSQSTELRSYRKFYRYLENKLEEGASLKDCFLSYRPVGGLFPKSLQQLLIAGEQSGSLSNALIKIGEMYEDKIETTTKNLAIILEPLLLFIVWLGVLGVAVAVILPIYSLVGSLNN